MLAKRSGTKTKNRQQKGPSPSDESIQSFRSWIRKLEQSTTSLSSRLSAVEKRISHQPFSPMSSMHSSGLEGSIERLFHNLHTEKDDATVSELSTLLDSEFSLVQETLVAQQAESVALREAMSEMESQLASIVEETKQTQAQQLEMLEQMTQRLEHMERREPPMMRLAGIEVPVEITGIIGGILSFVLAVLVFTGQKDIILSPLFLIVIGLLFIGSALFKTRHLTPIVSRPLGKKGNKTNNRL
ncbi:MAG: hypothetical protein JW771_05725 [Candidatus Thermoplasmatota archaeon]|nr:hypothetical protein [Candidatus Thermoplasmatota archaeon]